MTAHALTSPTVPQDLDGGIETQAVRSALAGLCSAAHPHLRSEARRISDGDERLLLQVEQEQARASTVGVRRARGAARSIVRDLLHAAGGPQAWPVIKGSAGSPSWPPGFEGSLAHDNDFAIAVVGRYQHGLRSVGVDIEPAAPLQTELVDLVATKAEIEHIQHGTLEGKLLFCIKEAAYKAIFPHERVILDFQDITFSPMTNVARSRLGCEADIFTARDKRVISLAIVR